MKMIILGDIDDGQNLLLHKRYLIHMAHQPESVEGMPSLSGCFQHTDRYSKEAK